jgi:hypothetical protein
MMAAVPAALFSCMGARNARSHYALDFECMPLQMSGSDRLIEGMEEIAVNRERVLSTMISKSVPRADQAAIAAKSTSACNTIPMLQKVSGRVMLV